MSRVVVLGAGVSGHTAAAFARKWLPKSDEVIVISPNSHYNWIPSNIWVGVGLMGPDKVRFPLAPVYERAGIDFRQAEARTIRPDGNARNPVPHVVIEYTGMGRTCETEEIRYDFLINATGPRLNFAATPGLGPDHHSLSVCTEHHAAQTATVLDRLVEQMRRGERKRFVVGTGHGSCTCQGAAFEYIVNLEFELRARKVRDRAEILWISNEFELGDFGMGGLHIKRGGYITPSKIFTESLFAERGIRWQSRSHVTSVESDRVRYETLEGAEGELPFEFAMLLPPFTGVGLTAEGPDGEDWTGRLFQPNGFMRVDADYSGKLYEDWSAGDWPRTYQNPDYSNLFSCGIAFAPPHAISRPRKTPSGAPIAPAPPRTGMPSAMIGKAVAGNVADLLRGAGTLTRTASMAEIGAACVASAGANPFTGTAASMTVFPIVPDFDRYPEYGRDPGRTTGEIGLAGHWIKILLHHMFLYKARLRPGWSLIPE